MKVTKEQFLAFEKVRASGVTNMFDIRFVEYSSGLSRETVLEITRKYGELSKMYGEARSETTKRL